MDTKSVREKLIVLLREGFRLDGSDEAVVADHLIANGVTVQKKGEWTGWNGDSCSLCGGRYMDYADADSYHAVGEPVPNFCPNCGADMRPESPKDGDK